MYSRDKQKRLDSISAKFEIDEQYTQRFFKDYEFAKLESNAAGLEMPPHLYIQLIDGFRELKGAPINSYTFDKIWGDSNKAGKASKANEDKHTNSHQWH